MFAKPGTKRNQEGEEEPRFHDAYAAVMRRNSNRYQRFDSEVPRPTVIDRDNPWKAARGGRFPEVAS
jgi:hypothetical protein